MTLQNHQIAFIGAGNMGTSILAGLLNAGVASAQNITCADVDAERLAALHDKYGVKTSSVTTDALAGADIVVMAVKPQILPLIMPKMLDFFNSEKLIISIAAGIPVNFFESAASTPLRVVRAMPNIAATANAAATALYAGKHATESDLALACEIFKAIGQVVAITDEKLMDAVTGLSGSGPAFIFIIAEALADAGVKMGLNRAQAQTLANQTILGAAKMLVETGSHPGVLKDMVTSPAGTTIAGLAAMENHGVRAGVMAAVEAATVRSQELSAYASETEKK